MNKLSKKVSSVVLSMTTALWLAGSGVIIPMAHGATVAELQTQIQALLSQIQALQSQLSTAQGTPAVSSYNYTRDLTVGSKGDDVTALQNFLMSQNKGAKAAALKVVGATGYFGSLTQAALAEYQASASISPAAGYFGPKSRAHVASLAAASTTTTTTPTTTTTTTTTAAGTGLTVSLASDQPAVGLFGESFASRPFTKIIFTASADGDVTVKSLTVERVGQGQDAAFNGVVDLDEDGVRLGDAKTFGSDHKLKLTDSFVVKAGQSRTITLAGDSDSDQDAYNGQLVGLSLTAVDAGSASVNGSFPMVGNYMTVNSTLAIGSLTLERGPLDPGTGATKEIGTKSYIFASLKMTAGSNEDVSVKSIRWNQSGSAATGDLANIKVYLDGTAYDAVVSADGKYYTAKFGNGLKIEKGGNKEVYVKGDVISGTNRGVDFDLYRYADIKVSGLTYGYDVLPTATDSSDSATDDDGTLQATQPNYDAYEVTIGAGSLTAEKATSVGAQNIAENLGDQPIGGFVVDVKGEDVSVAAMNFDMSTIEAAGTGGSIDTNDVTNIKLVDADGNVVAGPVDGVAGGNNAIRFTDTVTFKVGRKVYTLKGKLGTDFSQNDQVAASSTPSSDWTTVKGVTSAQTITPAGGTVTMSTMTLKTSAITVTISTDTASTSPNQNVVLGTGSYPFAKYVLDGSESGEDLRVTSMQLDLTTSYPANTADELTNCQLFDGSTALNTGTNVVNPANTDAAGADKTFTFDNSLTIPKGTVKSLVLKCNLTAGGTTEYVGWGLVSANATVAVSGTVSGTTLTTASGGGMTITADSGRTIVAQSTGTLALAIDSASPSLKLVQAASTDQSVTVFRLNASYEDVRLDQIGLQIATSTTAGGAQNANGSNSPSDLTKVTLWDGATKVGEVIFTSDYATATLSNFVIPKDAQKLLTVKADIAPVDVTLSQAVPGHLINVDWDAGWGDAADDDSNEQKQGFKAVGISSGSNIYGGTGIADTASNGARIVKAIPSLTKLSTSGKFNNTTDQTLYRFKIEAPSGTNGVSLYKFTFNVSTTTTSVVEYGGDGTDPGADFRVTNFRVYCYSDSGFSLASCGTSTGLLNQFGLGVVSSDETSLAFEDTASTADPDVDVAVYFNPTATSGATKEAIRIPSGETRYFEFKADVTGASSTPNISTKLFGDEAWQATFCTQAANELIVSMCDYGGETADAQDTEGTESAARDSAAFAGTGSSVDGDGATAAGGDASNDFIWSDNATNTTMSISTYDWFNGFLVPGLPTVSTGSETLSL